MYYQTPSHPNIIPQSDGRRIIFPLNQFRGTFKTDNFLPSLVDNRCSYEEINYLLNDISFTTLRMKPIRKSNRLVIWSLITFLSCFLFGIMIEVENTNIDYNKEDLDYSGICFILFGVLMLIIINISAWIYRYTQKYKLYNQVVSVLDRHKQPFQQKGLKWAVPENCNWLELWMDYRFFIPYYQYVPQYLPPNTNPYHPQLSNVANQAPDNLNRTNKVTPTSNNEEIATQSYPIFENNQPPSNANIDHDRANNALNVNARPAPFTSTTCSGPMFQTQEPAMNNNPSILQPGYPYLSYQVPLLNENTVGYWNANQDNTRLFRR